MTQDHTALTRGDEVLYFLEPTTTSKSAFQEIETLTCKSLIKVDLA